MRGEELMEYYENVEGQMNKQEAAQVLIDAIDWKTIKGDIKTALCLAINTLRSGG